MLDFMLSLSSSIYKLDRDNSFKLAFKSLSETTFSKRHEVQVRWSRGQGLASPVSIDGIVCETNSTQINIRMETISCPNALQSEAYVSTIALFLIFASSIKEEKAHLRLPPVWRDVWEGLRLLRKQDLDSRDMKDLRDLQDMIAEQNSSDEVDGTLMETGANDATRKATLSAERDTGDVARSAADEEALKLLWTSQSSTSLYQSMLELRKALPISKYKQHLLQALEENQVLIVCGETGCGKSTQVPSYILENELSSGRSCRIYCTEPRRISAISLARRVSEELGDKKGDVGTSRSFVGFAVRLDSQITSRTRLVYATTGIVMRMLESTHGLEEVTHLVIDEVHERKWSKI